MIIHHPCAHAHWIRIIPWGIPGVKCVGMIYLSVSQGKVTSPLSGSVSLGYVTQKDPTNHEPPSYEVPASLNSDRMSIQEHV